MDAAVVVAATISVYPVVAVHVYYVHASVLTSAVEAMIVVPVSCKNRNKLYTDYIQINFIQNFNWWRKTLDVPPCIISGTSGQLSE